MDELIVDVFEAGFEKRAPRRTVDLVALSSAFLLLLAGAASAAPNAPAVNPDASRLVLQLSNVPSGFERQSGSHVSNAQAAREEGQPLSRYVGWGRIDGYVVTYNWSVSAGSAPNGVTGIDSAASVYRAAAGAHSAFLRWAATVSESRGKVTAVAVGTGLGDESRAFRVEITNGGVRALSFVVGWRTGRFEGVLTETGTSGRLDPQSAFALAHRQQLRVRSAG